MQGVLVEAVGRRHLDDLPEVHDDDPIRDVPDDREIVGDEQVRETELGLQLLEQIDDLRLDRDVQRRDRLVADEELGVQGQRPGEADPLALPAGELVGVAVGGIAGKPDDAEQLLHAAIDLASCFATSWVRSGSPTIRPIECRGFSDAYGSWKTICIRLRIGRSSLSFSVVMSIPSNVMRPDVGS